MTIPPVTTLYTPGQKLYYLTTGSEGLCYPWSFCYMISNPFFTKSLHKKIQLDTFGEKKVGRDLVAIRSLLTIKKRCKTFNL